MSTARPRADIEAEETGDKTPGEDPAAAPLGTDEEATGTPIAPELAEQIRRMERRPAGEALSRQNATARREDAPAFENRTGGALAALLWLDARTSFGVTATAVVGAIVR
jgi:hypothetical protein